jgi:hypothetical protein
LVANAQEKLSVTIPIEEIRQHSAPLFQPNRLPADVSLPTPAESCFAAVTGDRLILFINSVA